MSRYLHYTSINVDVEVEITEGDLSNDDLLELCKERNIAVSGEIIEELYVMFKKGDYRSVVERMRVFVQDAKGVVL